MVATHINYGPYEIDRLGHLIMNDTLLDDRHCLYINWKVRRVFADTTRNWFTLQFASFADREEFLINKPDFHVCGHMLDIENYRLVGDKHLTFTNESKLLKTLQSACMLFGRFDQHDPCRQFRKVS